MSGQAEALVAYDATNRTGHIAGVRRAQRTAKLAIVDLDGAFSFTLFSGSLFIVLLGSYGALLFLCAFLGFAMLRPAAVARTIKKHWFFLLFPAYAFLSTIWSDETPHTLKHSLEYIITVVAGLLIATSRNQRSTMMGLFAAFAFYTIASLAMGTVVEVGQTGVSALSGLNDSKNQQADTVANGGLISLLIFANGLRSRRIFQCLLAGGIGLVQLYATIAAESAGALAGLAFALAVFCTLAMLRNATRSMRTAVMSTAGAIAAAGAIFILTFTDDMLRWLSVAFDKDVTLTGRTYLWTRAHELIFERPVAGRGFGAFWQQGNFDAEGIWRFAHIVNRGGFNFHNVAYDILVDLGWAGLVLFFATLAFGFWAAASGYVRRPTLFGCYWVALGAFLLVRMPIETIGIYEFYFSTVLLYAVFASSSADMRLIRSKRRPALQRLGPEASVARGALRSAAQAEARWRAP